MGITHYGVACSIRFPMRSSIVGGFVGSDTLRVPRIEGRSTECRGSGVSRDLAYKPEGRGGLSK